MHYNCCVSVLPLYLCGCFFSVDCEYEYICGECSATCGEATKECAIHVIQEARYGGKECPIVEQIHEVVCDDLPHCTPGIYHRIASVLSNMLHYIVVLWC